MVEVRVQIDGAAAIEAALDRKLTALRLAIESAINDEISQTHRDMAEKLRTYTHPIGTPTPSPPGHPPALVTGGLLRSIDETGARWIGPLVAEGSLAPTIVYSRIQELGGWTGRHHATYLPPRPYVAPVAEVAAVRFPRTLAERAATALRS